MIYKCLTIWLIALVVSKFSVAQTRLIIGKVLDSGTHVPLQGVSIDLDSTGRGTLTDADGKFRINVDNNTAKITFTFTGYHSLTIPVTDVQESPATIFLSKYYTELERVLVSARRKKYRNKNNPAVDLIRQVIANKSKNRPGSYPYLSYNQYEKIRVLISKSLSSVAHNRLLKKYRFFFDNVDTIMVPGKPLTSIYMQEVISRNYYQRKPEKKRQMIEGRKRVDYGEYIDTRGITAALNRMYEDINIYDNSISAFTLDFLSPVADAGPSFYMYFIRDTIVENGMKMVNLYFTPRNPEDLLFQGTLTITLDGNYAIRKAELGVGKHINLNYVRDFRVSLDFVKGPELHYYLATSDMIAHFSAFPRSAGFYAERLVTVSQLTDTILPDIAFAGPSPDTSMLSVPQQPSFWNQARPVPLSDPEALTYTNADSLVKMKSYHRLMDFITLLAIGYKSAGKFDIGKIGSFYSFNPVEGSKFLFGGRSNAKLSTRYFGDGYIAYGTKDQRWKYFISGTYSINHRSIYTYPFNYIQVSYLQDTKNPGQEGIFSQDNAFLSSFTRGYNGKWLYNDIFRLTNVREFSNHLSYVLGFKYWKQEPAGDLTYAYEPSPGKPDTVRMITSSELSATLRWAPHEAFFQNKVSRSDIVNKYPIITFQYAKGINGLFGGQYPYDALHLNMYKRCYLAPLGYSDITLDAEYLFGNLPFPLLNIPPVNQSYFYSYLSYNLMNTEEFVSDHYAALNIDHYFNGFFFNKLPLLKKMRLREVINAKVLYGGLRNENNPAFNPVQMKFPLVNGVASIYELGRSPYLEAGVGIYNIFSFMRVDLIRRFTYLDHPDISKMGLRFSTNFHF